MRLGAEIRVFRNDEVEVSEVLAMMPSGIMISPGPGKPSGAGISKELINRLDRQIPVLGICLGHQLIGEMSGALVIHAAEPVHGKPSDIWHDGKGIFDGIQSPFRGMRYHSLVLDPASLPGELEVSAHTSDGTIMAIRHRKLPFNGLQFHPESILTEEGEKLIGNWLGMCFEGEDVNL